MNIHVTWVLAFWHQKYPLTVPVRNWSSRFQSEKFQDGSGQEYSCCFQSGICQEGSSQKNSEIGIRQVGSSKEIGMLVGFSQDMTGKLVRMLGISSQNMPVSGWFQSGIGISKSGRLESEILRIGNGNQSGGEVRSSQK